MIPSLSLSENDPRGKLTSNVTNKSLLISPSLIFALISPLISA